MSEPQAAVVLVHGLWMPGTEMLPIRWRLERAGFATYVFRYHSVTHGLANNAARFAEFLARLPNPTVHFVGHSLGGVLILTTLSQYGVARAGRVVCLGSPLTGSCTAAALRRWRGGGRMIGQCMQDLLERGGVAAWSGQPAVGVIAGDFALGLGRIVGVLKGPNDGTVAVEETRLAGAADHIVLPVSHFSMLWSADVSRQILGFLESGRFLRESAG